MVEIKKLEIATIEQRCLICDSILVIEDAGDNDNYKPIYICENCDCIHEEVINSMIE